MPKFSVIVPVYKVEKYIAQCIESILSQSLTDFEILAVDDCGGDNSMSIVAEYAKHDNRIKILQHEKNRGLAAARNTALDAAQGDYIVCLDSDDWMEPNCLSVLYAQFNLRKTESIWFNSNSFYEETQKFGDKPMYSQEEGYRILTPSNIAAFADFTWIKAYTRSSIQNYNICWPEGLTFEDGEFYFKYFTHNPKTYVLSDCLINYRYREGSIVREANKGNVKMADIYTVVQHLKDFWEKNGLYDSYKYTLLKLVQNRISMFRNLNYSDENKKLAYEFMKKLGFPEEFKQYDEFNREPNPLVSVVIPIYNVEEYIEECLLSVINQTYKNLEIVCIDDCGQDNSMKIVKKYAKKDKRIKIIKHEENKGYCGAVNTGIESATGEFIFFVESDDYIEKDCIQIVTNKLIETQLNFVMFKIDRLELDGKRYSYEKWSHYYATLPEGNLFVDSQNMNNFPYFYWNKGYRRKFILQERVKWQNGGIYEDQEFFYRVFTNSPNTYIIDKSLYIYRIRESSLMGESFGKIKRVEDLFNVMTRIVNYLKENDLLKKYGSTIPNLIYNNLKWYRKYYSENKELVKMTLDFYKSINFPSGFISEDEKCQKFQ